LWLDLKIFATTRPNFNYFGHSHNYDATIKIFILLIASTLHLFSSINRLICPISRNSHQISCILKVFYNDIGVYFNVCTKIIYIICIHMYVVHIIWKFLFQLFKTLFTFEILIWIWCFYLNSKILFDLKIDIWILNYNFRIQKLVFQFRKLLIDYKNGNIYFEYFYLNIKIYISTLEIFHINFK
jgi:hypothetical protein